MNPNLPPVDLTGKVALVTGGGSIGAAGGSPYTYTLSAVAGDIFSLQVDRTAGNLNLGVVLISPTNQVSFYGGLIDSKTLSTSLTLPSEGKYTIGIFRVDLVPPAAPEAKTFEVLATLNP
jgi:hypothetical protein